MEILPPFKLLVAVRKEEMFGNSIEGIIKTSPHQSQSFSASGCPNKPGQFFLLKRAEPIFSCSLARKCHQKGFALSDIKISEKERD